MLRFWHDRIRMLGAITVPLLFLFVFGSGLRSRMGLLSPGIDFSQFMFPGVVSMTLMMSSFMAGVSVVWDREFGFLKEVLVAPISRTSVAIGKTLGAATVALLQGLLILSLAPAVGVDLSPGTLLCIVPLMFLLATCIGSLGVLLATRIRSMEAFQAATQMLMFPMVFLSGAFFPLGGLPAWMDTLVRINPATYGVASLRLVVLGAAQDSPFAVTLFGRTLSVWDNVGVLAAFGAVMTVLAMWSFQHQQ
jgi:ABC-2 type transport system permease protein